MSEEKRLLKGYFQDRLQELKDLGLSGALASRAAMAEVKALEAAGNLFRVVDELYDSGRQNVASFLLSDFYARLLLYIAGEDRERFSKVAVKMAEEIEKEWKEEGSP